MAPEIRQLPEGCGYQGYEFGAGRYPDSLCVGGWLYDADDCDEDQNLYEPMDSIPCPMCNVKEAISRYKDDFLFSTDRNKHGKLVNRFSKRGAARAARHLVKDIQKNRKNGTEPWKVAA